jgi:hypothetical protein
MDVIEEEFIKKLGGSTIKNMITEYNYKNLNFKDQEFPTHESIETTGGLSPKS